MAKQSLLVADADPRSLRILEVALRKAGFTVATAVDGAEALRRIQRSPPDLVVCEVTLPGQDGLSLCRAVRADERIAGMLILMTSADKTPSQQARVIEAGADDFLAKPLLIKELVTRVRLLLERRETQRNAQRESPAALTGTLGELGLVDLFQSLDNWRKSATVSCESEGRAAVVWVRDGQVIDAAAAPLSGEAAFYRVLNWETGSFRVEFGAVAREAVLDLGTAGLLMEAMRRVDELGRALETLPLDTRLAVEIAVLAQKLGELPDEVNGILKLFDGKRSLGQALDDSPLDDLSTLAVVQRLIADSILRNTRARAPLQKPSLQQWLGAALVSAPPPERSGFVFSPDDERASDPRPPDRSQVAPVLLAPTAALAESHAAPVKTLELVRFPPLRGVRRERLRREADEARAQLTAGGVLRLSRVVELPVFRSGGADELSPGVRRMSPAVGEAARKFAPDLPVAALQGFTRKDVALAPEVPLSEVATDPGFRAPQATGFAPPSGADDEQSSASFPELEFAQAASAEVAALSSPPETSTPADDGEAAARKAARELAAPAAGLEVARPGAALHVETVAPPGARAAAAGDQAPSLASEQVAGAPSAVPALAARALAAPALAAPALVEPVVAQRAAAAEVAMAPAAPSEADDLKADVGAASSHRRRWPWAAGAVAAAAALVFLLRPQPATDKKDSPWLVGAEPSAPATPASAKVDRATSSSMIQSSVPATRALQAVPAQAIAPLPGNVAPAQPPKAGDAAPGALPVAAASLTPAPETDDYARALDTGEKLLKRGRYRQAAIEFKVALKHNPESVPALLALGDAWLEGDAPRNALKPLQKAAALDPRSGRAQLLLGTAWQSLGKNPEAVKAYQRYLALDPAGEFSRDVRSILANLAP